MLVGFCDKQRPNNDVEGWHNRLNRRAKKGNLSFYMLLSLLTAKHVRSLSLFKLVKKGKLKRDQYKHSKCVPAKVASLSYWENILTNEVSTSSLAGYILRAARYYSPGARDPKSAVLTIYPTSR